MGFGIMPIFAKFAYHGGISATTLLSLRFIFSAIILFLYLNILGRSMKVGKKDFFYLCLLGGVFYSGTAITYFSALKYITTSLTVLLMYTHPMLVAGLSIVFNKEKLTSQTIIAMVVAFVGIILILGDTFLTKINGLGILLAVASAVFYSIYIFLSSRVIKNVNAIVTTGYISLTAAISMMGLGLIQGDLSYNFSGYVGLPLAGLVLISTIGGILFFLRGVDILGPTKSTIISMVEPVFAVVFSLIIFKESITTLQVLGGGAVLIGALMVMVRKKEVAEISIEEDLLPHN